jgi:hypothetical protein
MIKIVTLFIVLTSFPLAQADNEMLLGDKPFHWKTTDNCLKGRAGRDATYPSLDAVTFYECSDKTISFKQPDSVGINGWEGYCGQTALSNISAMMCGRYMSPYSNDFYATDDTPGQRPSTLKTALNKVFNEHPKNNSCPRGVWKIRENSSASRFMTKLKVDLFGADAVAFRYYSADRGIKVTPIPVLLNSGGLNYHWITVVDLINNPKDKYKCNVILNTWGVQKTLSCTQFIYYANHSNFGFTHIGFEITKKP